MNGIAERVRDAIKHAGISQKVLAERVEMKTDALSRALNGSRGFAAIELSEIASELGSDLHYLITGESDPARVVLSARHDYDSQTGQRSVSGAVDDGVVIEDICLAYKQVESVAAVPAGPVLPSSPADMREALGVGFTPAFIDRLEAVGVDVVRVEQLSTAYSLTIAGRPLIALNSSGNWFYENWGLAHELAHLALAHEGVMPGASGADSRERDANAFAAELLLPASGFTAVDWADLSRQDLAALLWGWGVSTSAVRNRFESLRMSVPADLGEPLQWSTQKVLRSYWQGNGGFFRDDITMRMSRAAMRHFPGWLKDAHLDGIAAGKMHKNTLAWMLEVDAESLEVVEPARPTLRSVDEITELLG